MITLQRLITPLKPFEGSDYSSPKTLKLQRNSSMECLVVHLKSHFAHWGEWLAARLPNSLMRGLIVCETFNKYFSTTLNVKNGHLNTLKMEWCRKYTQVLQIPLLEIGCYGDSFKWLIVWHQEWKLNISKNSFVSTMIRNM